MVRRLVPLTRTGQGVAIGALVMLAIGRFLGYREFTILAVACAVLLLAAVAIPRIASMARVERRLDHRMIQRGSEASMSIRVSTTGFVTPSRMIDQVGGQQVVLDVPGVIAHRPVQMHYRVRPARRGLHQVGPIMEERRDPFSLAFRALTHQVVDELWVHPVIHRLRPSIAGSEDRLRRIAIRTRSDDPLSDFRALRAYEPGDDPRRVHWPSSAKLGTLLVKEHVEFRRRERLIMLETLDTAATDDEFETAVEIAASLAMAAIDEGTQLVAVTRDARSSGMLRPLRDPIDVLKLFTQVRRTSESESVPLSRMARVLTGDSQVVVVGGAASPMIRAFCAERFRRSGVVAVRVNAGPTRLGRLPVPTVDVATAEDFAVQWGRGRLI